MKDDSKKFLCFINVFLSFVIFSILLVYIGFGYGKGDSFIGQSIPVCIFVFGILVIALLLAHYPYHPRKGLLFGAVYSLLLDLIVFVIIPLVQVVRGDYNGWGDTSAIPWIVTLGTALISGLFFWAAFIRED